MSSIARRIAELADERPDESAFTFVAVDGTAPSVTVPDLPGVVSPQSNGICSSGSTGLPKVIVSNRPGTYEPALTTPFANQWGRETPRPQTVLVLGPMYHLNGFYGLFNLIAGDRLVV